MIFLLYFISSGRIQSHGNELALSGMSRVFLTGTGPTELTGPTCR
jgi:hypothetical protein